MTASEKEAAKAAKQAEKEAAKAVKDSAPDSAPDNSLNSWDSLNYKDPKTGVNLVLAYRPSGEKAVRMSNVLASQPKVMTILPCEDGEIAGKAVCQKTINGFRIDIVKGVYVEIPKQMAEEIQQSHRDTIKAYDQKVSITDPITHQTRVISANLDNQTASDRQFTG